MATVATIYTLAPWPCTVADVLHKLRDASLEDNRPELERNRVWASVEHSPQRVIDDAFTEALRRDPGRRHRWVVLVAGERAGRAAGSLAGGVGAAGHPGLPCSQPAGGLSAAHVHDAGRQRGGREPVEHLPGVAGRGAPGSLESRPLAQGHRVRAAAGPAHALAHRHRLRERGRDLLLPVHDPRWL